VPLPDAVPRGTKVRSRRPTGAQELRAQRMRQEAQHKQSVAHAATRSTTRPANRSATQPAPRAPAAPHATAAPARASPPAIDFHLTGEYIALDNLLKLTGLAPSGGAAKALAASGAVRVDRIVELRKTCKIRAGQLVETAGARIRVRAAAPAVAD
jgi:ribosome-associated protein